MIWDILVWGAVAAGVLWILLDTIFDFFGDFKD